MFLDDTVFRLRRLQSSAFQTCSVERLAVVGVSSWEGVRLGVGVGGGGETQAASAEVIGSV